MRTRLGLVALTLAALTGCGSTVQQQGLAVGGPGLGGGAELGGPDLGAPSSGTPAPGPGTAVSVTPGGSSVPSGGAATTAPGGPTSPGSRPRITAGSKGRSSSGPIGTAPGVTPTTIKIGVYTAQGFGSFAASLGASIATGNNEAQAQAVIDHLNKSGGIAGRRIVPVFHDFDITAAQTDINTEYQRACELWTRDNRVYAVVTPIGTLNSNLYDCLSKAGVPTISAGDSKDASFLQTYANWFYQPTDMNQRRIMANNVDGLVAAGFFGSAAKVGVVLTNTPDETAAVDRGLKPALARHGMTLADVFASPTDNNAPAAYGNAVLRFKAEGITHVLFTSAASPIAFAQNAENQNYFPRYGLQSKNSPSTLQGVMSARSQRGAMGFGWQPMNDVDAQHDPGTISSRQALCLKLMRDAGENPSARASSVFGLWYCDMIFFLHDALGGAPSFALSGLRSGAEALASFNAASTFRSGFAPNRLHDGASAYRVFAFKDDCKCYQYVSPVKSAS
jgi:ABC-type branched-subunit amino acid transport system substrate-binding protein